MGDQIISTGPICETVVGSCVQWDKYTRQGVYFIVPNNWTGNMKYSTHYVYDPPTFSFSFEQVD